MMLKMVNGDLGRSLLSYRPVTAENWRDMQELFGKSGACGGCWCTYWRLSRRKFSSCQNTERKSLMKDLIDSGKVPGILAYLDKAPIGWCSLGPREAFTLLENSRVLKRVDEKPVWSIVCFYIERSSRRKGIMKELLKEAIRFAWSKGATVIEGYPIDPGSGNYPELYAYTGFFSAFKDLGFIEVERRSPKRPIMRLYSNETEC